MSGEVDVCIRQTGQPWACASSSTYTNRGCRGFACRAAHTLVVSVRREERVVALAAGAVTPEHGKASTYCNYGCRCRPCTTAWSAETKARRHRANARKAGAE